MSITSKEYLDECKAKAETLIDDIVNDTTDELADRLLFDEDNMTLLYLFSYMNETERDDIIYLLERRLEILAQSDGGVS